MSRALHFLPRRAHGDAGMSLIDLLMAMTISAIIVGALAGAFYFGFRTSTETETRLAESNKANVFGSYLSSDVGNALRVSNTIQGQVTVTATCGTTSRTVLLRLVAADGTETWYYQSQAGTELDRSRCIAGQLTETLRVAVNLSAAPDFHCLPAFDCTSGGGNTWQIVVAEIKQGSGANFYQTDVQAQKRVT